MNLAYASQRLALCRHFLHQHPAHHFVSCHGGKSRGLGLSTIHVVTDPIINRPSLTLGLISSIMDNIALKYDLLDNSGKAQVRALIDFLFSKSKASKEPLSAIRENLLQVSTWSEEDVRVFDETRQMMNNMKPGEW